MIAVRSYDIVPGDRVLVIGAGYMGLLNVQLLASIPNGLWIEDMGLSNDLFVEPVPVVDGMITAPERPGHGLAFKPEILRDCRV